MTPLANPVSALCTMLFISLFMKKTIIIIALCCIVLFSIDAQTLIKMSTNANGSDFPYYTYLDDYMYYMNYIAYIPKTENRNAYIMFQFFQNPAGPFGQFVFTDFGSAILINNGYSKVKLIYDKEISEKMTQAENNPYGEAFVYTTEEVSSVLKVLGSGYNFTITGTKTSLSDWRFPEITSFIDLCELIM